MKSSQIAIGQTYACKVNGKLVPVRITGKFGFMAGNRDHDGWIAINTATGREVRIKSPRRLQFPVI